MTDEENYRHRIAVLKTLDIDEFISGLDDKAKAHFHSLPAEKQREAAICAMHHARLKLPEMAESEHAESRAYLAERGLLRK